MDGGSTKPVPEDVSLLQDLVAREQEIEAELLEVRAEAERMVERARSEAERIKNEARQERDRQVAEANKSLAREFKTRERERIETLRALTARLNALDAAGMQERARTVLVEIFPELEELGSQHTLPGR